MKLSASLLFAVVVCLFAGSCGSKHEPEPIGYGRYPAELKISPCACIPIPAKKGLPDGFEKWFRPPVS